MAAFDFPNSPSVNDVHTENGVSFKWDGTVWKRQSGTGAQGPTGGTGAQGATGPTGAQGQKGAQAYISDAAPSSGVVAGDLWWDSDSGDFSIYFDDGSGSPSAQWVEVGSTGPTGPTGAQGATGPTGAQGAQGHQGATGGTGAQGAVGATGAQGDAGAAGAQGATGPSGSATITGNADNRVITGGSGTNLVGESNFTYDATTSILKLATSSSTSTDAELLHLVGGGTSNRGLKISTGRASGANQNHAAAIYDAINSESSGYGSQHRFKIAGTDCFTIGYNGDFGYVGINDNVPYPDAVGGNTVNTCLELGSPSGTDTASVIKFVGRDGSGNGNKCQIQWCGANNRFDITVNGNQALQIYTNKDVEVTDGDLVIGTAGHGISFANAADVASGETVSGSVLDDYEEGSFTPTYDNTGGVTPNYNYQEGRYTKVGNLVTCSGIIGCSNANSFGSGKIIRINLPFTCASNVYGQAGGALSDGMGWQNVVGGSYQAGTLISGSQSQGRIVTLSSSPSNVYYTGTPGLQNSHYFRFRYIYPV